MDDLLGQQLRVRFHLLRNEPLELLDAQRSRRNAQDSLRVVREVERVCDEQARADLAQNLVGSQPTSLLFVTEVLSNLIDVAQKWLEIYDLYRVRTLWKFELSLPAVDSGRGSPRLRRRLDLPLRREQRLAVACGVPLK